MLVAAERRRAVAAAAALRVSAAAVTRRLASGKAGPPAGKLSTQKPAAAKPAAAGGSGGAVAPTTPSNVVPGATERAVAGLSKEYAEEWARKAKLGAANPVVWEAPGAYVQTHRVPPEVLAALPPPRRPLYPMADGELTWKYLRSFALSLVFVGLAGYLHAKSRLGSGAARVELETRHPALAAALVAAGVLADYSHLLEEEVEQQQQQQEQASGDAGAAAANAASPPKRLRRGLDRALLFGRLFSRFAAVDAADVTAGASAAAGAPAAPSPPSVWGWLWGGDHAAAVGATSSSAEPLMPLPRALVLLALLRGDVDGAALAASAKTQAAAKTPAAAAEAAAAATSQLSAPEALVSALRPSPALRDAVASLPASTVARGALSEAEFTALAIAVTKGTSPIVLFLTASEALGVTPVSADTAEALGALYDDIIVSRSSGPAFTPAALAELVTDIGLACDEAAATSALADSAAVASGRYSLAQQEQDASSGSPKLQQQPVPITRDEFVNVASAAAAAASVGETRLPDYLAVFRMLHLSDARRSAGVAMH